ncbi:MAG: hypothetical protein AUF79_13200 [Crenarchaeota archaeon 13_1_20CM_2_51_8]|nr:MAG: hypothetical protein AUF79_13200 [Crenarchaeota archaeon 13_1_20CM_2_51_8]
MEAVRPSVKNWSVMEEVVSLLLNLSMLVPFLAQPRAWREFRERGVTVFSTISKAPTRYS